MFSPENPECILNWTIDDLKQLPPEDQHHEYKCGGKTSDKQLKNKIPVAASAFWNSGGGLFVIGVNDKIETDDGILNKVGNEERKEWIEKQILSVKPHAKYKIHNIDTIENKAIYLIAFWPSEAVPHMAPDNKYHIRLGACSDSAPHFIVEALFARRASRTPILSHILRIGAYGKECGIICLNDTPAISVDISLSNYKKKPSDKFERFKIPAITKDNPFFFEYDDRPLGGKDDNEFTITLHYQDLNGNNHTKTLNIDEKAQLNYTHNNISILLSNIAENIDNLSKRMERISIYLEHTLK